MYIVRETFTAKPGMASKLALMFKDVMGSIPGLKYRVLTDYVGPFNTVVLETEVEDLSAFEQVMADYDADTDMHEEMKGYTDMYATGRREVYKVV